MPKESLFSRLYVSVVETAEFAYSSAPELISSHIFDAISRFDETGSKSGAWKRSRQGAQRLPKVQLSVQHIVPCSATSAVGGVSDQSGDPGERGVASTATEGVAAAS
jgi:hypothetical protein